ncbi:MAG: CDP-alcohol phosphatidyltransferase family protein [bacterium]
MTLANYITIFRILLIPVFVAALLYYHDAAKSGVICETYRWTAAWAFFIAAISDALDGFLARFFNQKSRLGMVLDPLADKLLILSAVLVLSFIRVPGLLYFPLWFVVVVVGSDFLLVLGIALLYMMNCSVKMTPHWTGKVGTFLQMALVVAILLKINWLPFNELVWVAGGLAVVSLAIYLARSVIVFRASGSAQAGTEK